MLEVLWRIAEGRPLLVGHGVSLYQDVQKQAFDLPLPPLHVTAVAWAYFKKPSRIDLAALTLGATVPDIEPLFATATGQETHVLFHSFLGATLLSPLLAILVWVLERHAKRLIQFGYRFLRLRNTGAYPFNLVLISCLLGWLSHVFFDMWTHETFRYVLFPVVGENPFWFAYPIVHVVESFILLLSAYSILLWVRHIEMARQAPA